MKFGKQLASTLVAEWSDYYVDYKVLKKEIKAISSSGAMPPVQVERFVELLSEQLDVVNLFFKTEEASVMAKWKTIDMANIQAPTDNDKAAMVQWLRQRLRLSTGSDQEGGSEMVSLAGHMSAKLKASKHQLSLFCTVYNAAQKLSQYVAINYVAFVKGMKKFEKRTALSVGHIFMPRLQRANFFNSPSLAILLAEVDFSAKDLLLRLGVGGAETDILEEFRCCLCHELMRQPIVLSCSHRFCWQCTAQASAVASTEGEWCCPTCRRPQVLNPEIYCVATSLSTLVERHMPAGASTRDGNLMEAREASLKAAATTSAAAHESVNASLASAVASPVADLQQTQHQHAPEQLNGADALLSAAFDLETGATGLTPAVPLPTSGRRNGGVSSAKSLTATLADGQETAAEEPTMVVALAVDPSSSIITATKEQSYYDDLITLADVELPDFPFDLHDNDLTSMLPEAERGDHPVLEDAELQPVMQNPSFPSAAQFQLDTPLPVQLAQPGSHDGGMRVTAPMEPARAAAMPKPERRGQKRETSSTQAEGGKQKRARSPKKTLTETEIREKRMIAQRAYRQRMGRASELRKDFESLRKSLADSQSKLYSHGQQLRSMLSALNWPPELLQVLPTQGLAPGEPAPNSHQAAVAAALGAAMSNASRVSVSDGATDIAGELAPGSAAAGASGGDGAVEPGVKLKPQ